jgi:hypothetical protein
VQLRPAYVAALLGLLSMPAIAQQSSPRDAASLTDARVRVTMASRERVTGTVVALRADSMVLTVPSTGSKRGLARSEIASIERSTGTKRYRLRGAAIGFVVGAGVGAAVGSSKKSDSSFDEDLNGIAGAFVGALAGTTLGVVVGARKREQWRRVADDRGVRVGISPAPGGRVALSLAVRR